MIMKKTYAFLIVLAAALFCFGATPPPASSMNLTLDDGEEVILQPDSTWDYAKPSILGKKEDDKFITLNDNRIIWLKPDYTWTFTDKQPKSNKPQEYPSIAIVGSATKGALDIAVSAATDDAFTKAATNLRRHAPASKKNIQPFLIACLKNEVGEHGVEIVYNKGAQGFKADAKISLTNLQVAKVMDCLEVQLTQ